MKDKISIPRVELLHPNIRNEVKAVIDLAEAKLQANVAIRIVQGLRTIEEQNALYAQGRTKPGPIVTKAKGGSSFHNYGLAIDFCLLYDKDNNGTFEALSWDVKDPNWMIVVKEFEVAGYFWGGKFSSLKDYPHLQKTYGNKWQELQTRHNNKDFIPGTEFVRL